MSTEYRLVTFRVPASSVIPERAGGVTSLTVDFLKSIPEISEHMDGWEVVNSQIHAYVEQDVMITFFLKMENKAPSPEAFL